MKPIMQSTLAMEKTNEPVKKHKLRLSDLRQLEKRINRNPDKKIFLYHDRIQKKWIKRFGYIMKPCIFETPTHYICHPALYNELKKTMDDALKRAEDNYLGGEPWFYQG